MRNRFDEELARLDRELISMGALCENAIASAAKALLDGDFGLGARVAETDAEIDRREREIEGLCMRLLLHQQPVAGDLRLISSALKMITDMERIGDQAEDIAEIVLAGRITAPDRDGHLGDMARAVIRMVTDSVDAFVGRDAALARAVIAADDTVDALFDAVKFDLVRLFSGNGQEAEYALDILMIAKYLERIGDHATNIAEWVVFSITGRHPEEAEG